MGLKKIKHFQKYEYFNANETNYNKLDLKITKQLTKLISKS